MAASAVVAVKATGVDATGDRQKHFYRVKEICASKYMKLKICCQVGLSNLFFALAQNTVSPNYFQHEFFEDNFEILNKNDRSYLFTTTNLLKNTLIFDFCYFL